MLVTLVALALHGDQVRFTSSSGEGTARWRGDRHDGSDPVYVELNIVDRVDWGRIVLGDASGSSIRPHGEYMSIRGTIEDLDQYGVLTLRVGDESLLVETAGDAPPDIVGREASFIVHDAELYPTNI